MSTFITTLGYIVGRRIWPFKKKIKNQDSFSALQDR